jgi:hypothetical protein
VDVETAKATGRKQFGEMLRFLERNLASRTVIVEKTDRLYRNFKDYVTLEDLDVEIHLAKEGLVVGKDAKSPAKLMHGIQVVLARNYIENLREEVRKGMREKAEQGIYPSRYSPAFLLRDELARRGAEVRLHDPLYSEQEMRGHGFSPGRLDDKSAPEALVLITSHPEYAKLDFAALASRGVKAVVDGRALWSPEAVRAAGLLYVGVGRGEPRLLTPPLLSQDSGDDARNRPI